MKPISGNYTKAKNPINPNVHLFHNGKCSVSVEDKGKFVLVGIAQFANHGRKPTDSTCQKVLADFGIKNATAWVQKDWERARYFEVQK